MKKEEYKHAHEMALTLSKMSTHDELQEILEHTATLKPEAFELDKIIRAVAQTTGSGLKVIRQEYGLVLKKLKMIPDDIGFTIAQVTLNKFYAETGLKLYPDGNFYIYDQTYWRITTKEQVRSHIQETATEFLYKSDSNLKNLVNDAYACLCDFLGTDQDALDFSKNPESVINFKNGELWINPDGSVELCPHKPESRLFYCLDIQYDPKAKAPQYEQALLDIFSEAENPNDVIKYWHEFVGYAIQPRRFVASFFVLIGHGRNGKTKRLDTMQKLSGHGTVLNDNLSTFQKDRFNAAALRGKLILIDDDLDSKTVLSDGFLKKYQKQK